MLSMTAAIWTDRVPVQGLGLMRLTDDGWGDSDRDPATLVQVALDEGVTLLDTAEMYGNEDIVGRALGSHRDQITLCSKFGEYRGDSGRHDDWYVRADPATVRTAVDGSLGRLGVDHLDLYYLHHRSEETPIEETVEAMAELKQAGKIRALGLSNVTLEDIRRAHAVHPIAAVQEQWSLTQRGVEDYLPTLAELGIALVAHSPMGHGVLHQNADGKLAHELSRIASELRVGAGQVALAWVHQCARQTQGTVIPLPGTSSVSHLRANVAASRIELGDVDIRRLTAAV